MKKTALLLIGLVLSASPLAASNSGLAADIAFQAQDRIDKGYHLGTVIGVIDRNGPRYYGFGRLSLEGNAKPDENSIFEIGSITKPVSATLMAILDGSGDILLQATAADFMPVLSKSADPDGAISITDLLNHTSGFARDPLDIDAEDDHRFQNYSLDQFHQFLAGYKPEAKPGSYSYSNLGYMIIERAVEQSLETDFETLMHKRLLEPLMMSDSHFAVPDEKQPRLVTGFRQGAETDALDLGHYSSFGGLRSTAQDMLHFIGAQIGVYKTPMDAAIKETQRIRLRDGKKVLALGWEVMERHESGKTLYFHRGGTNGFVSLAAFDLENQKGVIVLVNGRNWFSDLGFRVLDASYPLKEDLPSIAGS
ncbi:serine hydrolase [Microbulbifer sp. 2205BS26-8]|uniref:serine hydrolase domain-containing protein n=1 Tax=Microbulbifer sp. 2205BS26-8 TaxID=3064386 RepID=UPI00273D21AF|nr:serine hydrolase domain-containing protein [Microbulbifer sp. 2205BS26-8]MDP5208221.1 serine hydrolase domain-containing protein [Microbulbifer sp. 2205BS26-8]